MSDKTLTKDRQMAVKKIKENQKLIKNGEHSERVLFIRLVDIAKHLRFLKK